MEQNKEITKNWKIWMKKFFSIDVLMILFIKAGLLSKKSDLNENSHIVRNCFSQNIDSIISAGVRNLSILDKVLNCFLIRSMSAQ